MLCLLILSELSHAQTIFTPEEKVSLSERNIKNTKRFSLKNPVNTSFMLSTGENKDSAIRSPLVYVNNGSFYWERAMEEKSKNGLRIVHAKPSLNQGKIVGEFMAGTVLGMGMGLAAASVGASISYDGSWFSEWPGAIVGFTLAYPLGCAVGIYLVGNLGSDTGSFVSALGAAYGGLFLGAAGAWGLSHVSQTAAGVAFLAAPPLLATLVFNNTRRYKNSSISSASLLNFREGKIDLEFPAILVLPSAPGSSKLVWLVNLASFEF
jgi:hypothetical protein